MPAVDAPPPSRARIGLAAILFVTLLVSYFDRINVSVLVADPRFLAEMGVSGTVQMGLLLTSFLLAYGLSNLVVGPVGRWLGPRRAMALSILVWALSVAAGGVAESFGMLLATRIVLGIGEGLHWPMQSIFVKNWFPPAERARANSAWLLGIMVGPMIAVPLITSSVSLAGWRSSFALLVACSLLPLGLVWFFTTDRPDQSRYVNAAELRHIEQGLALEREMAGQQVRGSWAFLRNADYWLIVLAFTSSAAMFWGTVAWLPSYLKVARGFAWAHMGWLATLPYAIGTVTVLLAGQIADRIRIQAVLPLCSLLGAAASIYLGAQVQDNTTSAYGLSAAVGCLGLGLASYWTMMQNIVPQGDVGSAAGVMNGVASLTSAFIPTLVGALIAAHGGDYTSGLMSLVAMGCLGGAAMLVLAWRMRRVLR